MTIDIFVEAGNKPDVLARVVMLFHRRGVQIQWLNMVTADSEGILRIKVVAELEEAHAMRITADLYKLRDVRSLRISAGGQVLEETQAAEKR